MGEGNPAPWILGSSPNSAVVAGPARASVLLRRHHQPPRHRHRSRHIPPVFRPLLRAASARPYVLVAVSVTVAETEAAAARLRASLEIYDLQLSAASRRPSRPPTPRSNGSVACPNRPPTYRATGRNGSRLRRGGRGSWHDAAVGVTGGQRVRLGFTVGAECARRSLTPLSQSDHHRGYGAIVPILMKRMSKSILPDGSVRCGGQV